MKFDKGSSNALIIMYPTGGFGNFLHLLLDRHLGCTVKSDNSNFAFSDTGNSHLVKKHVEQFSLGSLGKNFSYGYNINESHVADQIGQDKKFLVLADMGNKGDNVAFLRRYFPNAQIIRTYAQSFEEKLIVWFNCMTKTPIRHKTYPGALLTHQGIQQWANTESITDQHAVDCMTAFFINDFSPFGRFFNCPVDGVINLPIHRFFKAEYIVSMLQEMADVLASAVIDPQGLKSCAQQFVDAQNCFHLLDHRIDDYPLISKSIYAYRHQLAKQKDQD